MPLNQTTAPRERYDAWAESYDEHTTRFGWTAPQFLLEAVMSHLPPVGYLRVLDVGVGTGQVSVPYLEAGASVTGLDVSSRMLYQAQSKNPQFHALIEHDFNRPLADAGLQPKSFDLVLSCGALHFAHDLSQTLKELKWVLAPGGLLAFTYIPPQTRQFSAATQIQEPFAVEQMLHQLGLTVLNHEPFVAYYEAGNSDDPVMYQRIIARCSQSALPLPELLQNIDRTACVDRTKLLSIVSRSLMSGAVSTHWTDDITTVFRESQELLKTLQSQFNEGELEPRYLPLPSVTAQIARQGVAECDVLVLMPHPDDESIYAGGTIASLSESGKRIRLVVATDGAAGRGGKDSTRVALRAQELYHAANILSIEQVEFLGLADFGKYRDTAKTQPITAADTLRTWGLDTTLFAIVRCFRQHRPRVLLTLHPEVDPNYSLHGHHLGLSVAALVAFHLAADPGFVVPDAPELLPWAIEEHQAIVPLNHKGEEIIRVEIDRQRKRLALQAYETQRYSTQRLLKALETGLPSASFEAIQTLQARCRRTQIMAIPLLLRQQTNSVISNRTWDSAYNALRQRSYPRNALCNLLLQQADVWGASQAVLDNITRLRASETVAVVTGQQVGILGGPVYTLYKALGAVRLARDLETQGIPAVPVFWMASYDHDIEEVQKVELLAHQAQPQMFSLGLHSQQRPVGAIPLGDSIHFLLDEVEQALCDLPYAQTAMAELRAAYQANATFAQSFARWLTRLTNQLGLVILEPASRGLAELYSNIIYKEIFGTERSQQALNRTRQALAAEGRTEIIPTERDFLQMFYVDEQGIRRRLRKIDGGFELQQTDAHLSDKAARNILELEPERFTPSALLRPICQDSVLPTIAYVAGPTEQQYFTQLPEVYTWAGLPMPKIVARPSFTVIDGNTSDLLAQAGGAAMLLSSDDASARLGQASLPESVRLVCDNLIALQQRSFDLRTAAIAGECLGDLTIAFQKDIEQWLSETTSILQAWGAKRPLETITRLATELPPLVATICSDLQRSGSRGAPPPTRNLVSLAQEFARFERALIREGRRQNAAGIAAFSYVNPGGKPQERCLSIAELIATYGFSIVERLLPMACPDSNQRRLVTIRC
jgi:bacillithiol biosynthesis cysteine-adding enzyme BshC